MRKFVGMITLVCMIFQAVSIGFCETSNNDAYIYFEPTLTNAADATASEWYDASDMRALLTILLALDIKGSFPEEDSEQELDLSSPSYVGKRGLDLCVAFKVDSFYLVSIYSPFTKEAYYFKLESVDDTLEWLVETFMSTLCTDGYEENDIEQLLLAAEDLSEIFAQ